MDKAQQIVKHLLENDEEDADLVREVSDEPVQPDPYDAWIEKYRPIQNPFVNDESEIPFDGTMFETYGEEVAFVQNKNPHNVWTLVSGDEGEDVITADFHFVNRQGYFVTEIPWTDPTEYVLLSGPAQAPEENE